MEHDELIEVARRYARRVAGNPKVDITMEILPKVRVVEALIVNFESDEHDGRIEVTIDKESGKFLGAGTWAAKWIK